MIRVLESGIKFSRNFYTVFSVIFYIVLEFNQVMLSKDWKYLKPWCAYCKKWFVSTRSYVIFISILDCPDQGPDQFRARKVINICISHWGAATICISFTIWSLNNELDSSTTLSLRYFYDRKIYVFPLQSFYKYLFKFSSVKEIFSYRILKRIITHRPPSK